MKKTLIVFVLLLFAMGCRSQEEKTKPISKEPTNLSQIYPGDLGKVDKMQLLDGSTGERIMLTDREIIRQWLNQIRDVQLIPADNQEGRVGYLFGLTLYENDKSMLGFIPDHIGGIYYENNDAFLAPIRALFEEQFGRSFGGSR